MGGVLPGGFLIDASLGVMHNNNDLGPRFIYNSDLARQTNDAQFNLVGYSWGSVVAAQQAISILREQEQGRPTAEVCRTHGISANTFYRWKSKYGGMEVSDARRLRQLEDENSRLKRLLAEQVLDNTMLKDLLGKN